MPFLPFTDEQLQALEEKFSRIDKCRGETPARRSWHKADPEPPWEVVFRAPTMGECDKFEGDANNERAQAGSARNLSRAIVVGVSYKGKILMHDGQRQGAAEKAVREGWDALRQDYPAVHMACAETIKALMGGVIATEGKE